MNIIEYYPTFVKIYVCVYTHALSLKRVFFTCLEISLEDLKPYYL